MVLDEVDDVSSLTLSPVAASSMLRFLACRRASSRFWSCQNKTVTLSYTLSSLIIDFDPLSGYCKCGNFCEVVIFVCDCAYIMKVFPTQK